MSKLDNNNIVRTNISVREALELLEKLKCKTLILVDKDEKVLASVTDGDIRRAMLCGASLESAIYDYSNKNPIIYRYTGGEINKTVKDIMSNNKILILPIVDIDGRIIDLVFDNRNESLSVRNIGLPVVIMAGGKGTRLYPFTKILPKPLIPINGIPISERIIDRLFMAGCEDFYLIINYKKKMIKSYYEDLECNYNIHFCEETMPLGTGGGLKLVEKNINGRFVMTNSDVLMLDDVSRIIEYHEKENNKATVVCCLNNYEIPYGIVHYNENGLLDRFEEKPKMSFYTNTGFYILEKEVFEFVEKDIAISMPEILVKMKNAGLRVGVFPVPEKKWLDMGQFDSMESMEQRLREISEIRDESI